MTNSKFYKVIIRNTPWNLQMFADEDTPADNDADNSGSEQEDKPKDTDKKYSDADVNRIIDRKFAEWQKKQDEAVKLKNMTDQQKAEHERDELKKQIAELQKAQSREAMMKQVRTMLRDAKINAGDELVAPLVAEDAETTKATVEGFIKTFNEAVQDAVKKALKGNTPKVGATAPTMTKAEIMAVKNPQERQRLIRENWQLFQK